MAPSRRRGSSKASSATAAAANWKVGDLVLAKVKGFPAWPATVSEPEKWGYSTDWKKVLVYFFGTKQIAFCNYADVEAFTEEKKKSLLSKRHGKGADFVRAVQEIVESYEKAKNQELDDEITSGDEDTIANDGHLEITMGITGNEIQPRSPMVKANSRFTMGITGNEIQPQSPMVKANSRFESLCDATANNESHYIIDIQAEMENGSSHEMDTVIEEQKENASSLDDRRGTTLADSDSLTKELIETPLQSCVIQKRPVVRRSRSTMKIEPRKFQNQVTPLNDRSSKTESHHLIDVQAKMENGGSHEMDTVSGEQDEIVSSLDALRETPLVDSESITTGMINAPLQSCVVQKRTVARRSRSTLKIEARKRRSQAMPLNDSITNTGNVLLKGARKESVKRSRRVRKSPGTSVWYHMESPGYSASFASNISSEENDSEMGATHSDMISFNGGNTLDHSCKIEHPGFDVECLDPLAQLSDRVHLPDETFVFKNKRKPNRKRIVQAPVALSSSPIKRHVLDCAPNTQVEKTVPHSPNGCENLPDRFLRADGDEHLPLVKRARVRMGKPPLEEKQLNDLVGAEEESSKEVSINNLEPPVSSISSVNGFQDVLAPSASNGVTQKDPIWNSRNYPLRTLVDGEAALPPSKRIHRALEAMSANVAEEDQTFGDAQRITNVSSSGCTHSSDKSSSYVSVDNEVGSASEVQNVNTLIHSDASVNGESKFLPGLITHTSEVLARAFPVAKFRDNFVECSITSKTEDSKEMELVWRNSFEMNNGDNSSLHISDEAKASIRSPHTSRSVDQKQVVLESRLEPMDISSPSLKREKLVVLGSGHDSLKIEHLHLQEDKSAQEQVNSQSNHWGRDSSEVDQSGFCSQGVDSVNIALMNVDPCKSLQSLSSSLYEDVQAMCEVVEEVKYKAAEEDLDASSMKVLIAAAQAKQQLSLSTSLSDNVLDDKVLCNSISSPSSPARVGSSEQVSPPSSATCHLSTVDNRNHLTHNGSVCLLPHSKKSTCLLEMEEVGHMASTFSHSQKSLGKWTVGEANAARKSFESMLGTLTRTKESIGRATRFAIECAKYGIASEVLDILVRNLETESSLHRRVDIFFLVDSITQCSRGQKGDIGDIYPSAVQGMLPRLLAAAAPPGTAARENRRQCLKVLRLWLERKTLPESIIRHHMRELESANASSLHIHSRRPLRMERAMNDPIREMEGMQVDEYGSNASFQLPGFCMPRMLEDGSDAEERSFEAVTPEQDPDIQVLRGATPTSTFEKRCHILEDVDGELEMEDVAPSYEIKESSANGVIAVQNSHNRFAPPLPGDFPPTPPPLPASPPPVVPLPPLHPQSLVCQPFTDSADLKLHTNSHEMQKHLTQRMSQQLDGAPALKPVIPDTAHYYASGYGNMGTQSLRPGFFSSSSSCCTTPAPYPSVSTGNKVHRIDGGPLHNKSYHLQPPPPTLSNQFSYVHAEQRKVSWMEASSSSFTKRFRSGLDMHREDIYENRERMELTPHENGERCRIAAPGHSVPVQSHNSEAAYAHVPHYGPSQEPTRILDRGWSFPPRTIHYHNPTVFRPPEAPIFWRPR